MGPRPMPAAALDCRQASGRAGRALVLAAALAGAGGCELQEITLAQSEDLVIAEVYVQIRSTSTEMTAFLHRTQDGSRPREAPAAQVRITGRDGRSWVLAQEPESSCLVTEASQPIRVVGSCYAASAVGQRPLPGDTLQLEIETDRGERLTGLSVIPGGFTLTAPTPRICGLEPLTTREVRWTRSEGAWAYLAETLISGLRGSGVPVESDPLNLVGVSVSAADTTIIFPSEFGVFERFDLDRDLALLLQQGLPEGTSSSVIIGAVDRNWVNWVRGGNFNPSGQTRTPSVRGDGTGVFGSVVRQSARYDVPGLGLPPCST